MKPDQLQQAQQLYFQTELSKSQIAQALGVSRRSIHYWVQQYRWDRMKQNARSMPVYIAENCYQLMGRLTDDILSAGRADKPVTMQEANMLYKLTLTVSKLRARSTLNENMEVFTRFTDEVTATDPALAKQIGPHIDQFIARQSATAHKQHNGHYTPGPPSAADRAMEDVLDLEDIVAWQNEKPETSGDTAFTQAPAPAASGSPAAGKAPVSAAGNDLRSQPKPDLRKMLRGTATSGPGKAFNRNQAAARHAG